MKTRQIAAEAWDKIRRYYGVEIADGTGLFEIEAAIEKATKELSDELRQEKLALEQMAARFNRHMIESRAAHASEPPFPTAKHHASCTPNDQDLMWVCAQCGHKEPEEKQT